MFTGAALLVLGYLLGVLVPPNRVDDVFRKAQKVWRNRRG